MMEPDVFDVIVVPWQHGHGEGQLGGVADELNAEGVNLPSDEGDGRCRRDIGIGLYVRVGRLRIIDGRGPRGLQVVLSRDDVEVVVASRV